MKHISFILLFLIVFTCSKAQSLFDGMYSKEWVAERDAIIKANGEKRRWQDDYYYRNLIGSNRGGSYNTRYSSGVMVRQSGGIQFSNDSPYSASKTYTGVQREAIRKYNRDIERRNFYTRRQEEIAEQRRAEEIARLQREEAEMRQREHIRQSVYATTYMALEASTRAKQEAAYYRTHEGADLLDRMHSASNLTHLAEGNNFGKSEYGTMPRKNFSKSLRKEKKKSFYIDPDRVYNLATWQNSTFEDLHFVDRPMLSMEEHKIIDGLHDAFKEATGMNIVAIMAKENKTPEDLKAIEAYKAFRQNQLDEIESDKNAAVMSALVYSDHDKSLEKETDFRPIKTFSDVLKSDKEVYPLFNLINTCNNAKDNEGFHAEVFYNEKTKEYTVSFRGTEATWEDIVTTDIKQGMGYNSKQFDMAIEIGKQIKQLSSDKNLKINITGHSLGGGLATIAGVISGNPTTVFNPSGVHENTYKKAGVWDKVQQGNYNIKKISEKNDILTNSQEGKGIVYKTVNFAAKSLSADIKLSTHSANPFKSEKDLPKGIGKKETLNTNQGNPFSAHSMAPMARLLIAHNGQAKNAVENANEFLGI